MGHVPRTLLALLLVALLVAGCGPVTSTEPPAGVHAPIEAANHTAA